MNSKKNSIIFLQAYVVDKNNEDASKGRTRTLHVLFATVSHTNFPCRIGDPKDIFDAGVGPADPKLSSHPRLFLIPGTVRGTLDATGPMGGLFSCPTPINFRVGPITKVNKLLWHFTLGDGEKSIKALSIRMQIVRLLEFK
jgi:hypothetical protein